MNGAARDTGTGYEVRPGTVDRRIVETGCVDDETALVRTHAGNFREDAVPV